jgi:hypothetical protein
MLLLGFRVQFVAVLRSVWDSGKFAELQLCWVLWILIYWRGLGFGFGFSASEFPVFGLVFEFEYCLELRASERAVGNRLLATPATSTTTTTCGGRLAGGRSDEEPFGSFESNGNFSSVIRSVIEECPSLFPRVFAFFVLFFLSPTLLLLQKSWCCWVLLRIIEEY